METKTLGWIELVIGVLVLLFALFSTGDTMKWAEVILGLLGAIFGIVGVASK